MVAAAICGIRPIGDAGGSNRDLCSGSDIDHTGVEAGEGEFSIV